MIAQVIKAKGLRKGDLLLTGQLWSRVDEVTGDWPDDPVWLEVQCEGLKSERISATSRVVVVRS